ncbi:MAG: gliding motility-associated C-terminal domain-containing protein, partial [Bacteroidota bacterium]|nr:gliding motility-associated C-terminal domain-containing protein [Bacteroidota bacterium]
AVFNSNTLSNGDALYCLITPGNNSCSSSPVSSNVIIAIVKDLPEITIIPNDTTINISQKVQLKAKVSGNIASYQWIPADKLENQFTLTPSTVNLTDDITYTLTVQSGNGCEASSSAIVKVVRLLIMPNAFSPNGDGTNDIFHIPAGVSLQLQEFSIFDRWGTRVFTTKNISEGWYGTFKGTPVDAGTYIYIIKGRNEKGNILLKGSVILLR